MNTHPTDGWHLFDAEGVCIGSGTGYVMAQEGETLIMSDDPSLDTAQICLLNASAAQGVVLDVNAEDRTSAFEAKYAAAVQFMTDVAAQPDVDPLQILDAAAHDALYTEYFYTWDVYNGSVTDLAQAIIGRHTAPGSLSLTDIEARRRRRKLLAEAVIAANPPATLES